MTYLKYGIGLLFIVIGVLFVVYVDPAKKVPATPVSDFLAHSVLVTLGVMLIILTYAQYLATLIALFGLFVIETGLIALVTSLEKKKIFLSIPSDIAHYIIWLGFGVLVLFYSKQTHNKRKIRNEKT